MDRRIALVGVATAVVAGAAAMATAAGGTPRTDACGTPRHGLVRMDGNACRHGRPQPPGPGEPVAGRMGPKGDTGAQGPPGPAGPKGEAGGRLGSIEELAGTACTTFEGGAGRVEIAVTATDSITFRCAEEKATPPPPATRSAKLVLNEVDYDQVGADTTGFVEIANTGAATATLDGVALVLVNGGDGAEYGRKALTGTLAAGAKLLVEIDPQNGAPDGLALVDTSREALLDGLSYEGEIRSATIGTKVFDLVEGTPLPAEIADSNSAAGTLARIPDGADSGSAATDWSFTTTPTPGGANVETP